MRLVCPRSLFSFADVSLAAKPNSSSIHGLSPPSPLSSSETISIEDNSYSRIPDPPGLQDFRVGTPIHIGDSFASQHGTSVHTHDRTRSTSPSHDSQDSVSNSNDSHESERKGGSEAKSNFYKINWRVVGGGVKMGTDRDCKLHFALLISIY